MAVLFYVKLKNGTAHLFEAQHLTLHNGSLTLVVTDSDARTLFPLGGGHDACRPALHAAPGARGRPALPAGAGGRVAAMRLKGACALLDIEFVDTVVVAEDSYVSLRESGLL